jgi:hypothetical protein
MLGGFRTMQFQPPFKTIVLELKPIPEPHDSLVIHLRTRFVLMQLFSFISFCNRLANQTDICHQQVLHHVILLSVGR